MYRLAIAILTILLIACAFSLSAQLSVSANVAGLPRPIPEVGFNLNAHTRPSWDNTSFRDSLKRLGVAVLRYPGGTESQYWDWQNGQSLPVSAWAINGGTLQNFGYLGTSRMVPFPLEAYKRMLDTLQAVPVIVLNVLSRTLEDQMRMLRRAAQLGIPVDRVELGNEMYFPETDFVRRFPTAGAYAREMQVWTDSIKAAFPGARVGIIGTTTRPVLPNGNPTPARIRFWNDSIYTHYQYRDAITLHNYFRHNSTSAVPDPVQVMASAFSEWQDSRLFGVDPIDPGMTIWFTEYNMNDGSQNYRVATTWLHGLFTAAIHLQMLEARQIDMILNHQITGLAPFASLDSYTLFGDTLSNRLTAEGNAMRLLHGAYKNKRFADKLVFSRNPAITYDTIVYPSLTGWVFYSDTSRSILLLNSSSNTFTFQTEGLVGGSFQYETITSREIARIHSTTEHLSISSGKGNSIPIPAYSLTLMEEASSVTPALEAQTTHRDLFVAYPNPAAQAVFIELRDFLTGQPAVLDIFAPDGRRIISKTITDSVTRLPTGEWPSGIYFLRIKQKEKIQTEKLFVESR